MDEYIEREALEVDLNHRLKFLMTEYGEYDHYTSGFDEAVTRVENFPSADVAPVRHGRWVRGETDTKQFFLCNRGRKREHWEGNYCPRCGAKMDGGDDE